MIIYKGVIVCEGRTMTVAEATEHAANIRSKAPILEEAGFTHSAQRCLDIAAEIEAALKAASDGPIDYGNV